MRAFIAIELSDEIREILAQIQSHLKYSGADVKWIENNNIHLTLKFIGNITEEKCGKIKSILDKIAKNTKPFELSLKVSKEAPGTFIGAFPNINYPRVIWVGLDKGVKESTEITERIDEELAEIGLEKESRPFAAHMTIGRVRSPKNKEALKEKVLSASNSMPNTQYSQLIQAITLYKSTLTPKGPIYMKLHEANFAA